MFNDIIKLAILSNIKTNNPGFDTILTIILMFILSYIVNKPHVLSFQSCSQIVDYFESCIYRKYSISFEGKHNYIISKFDTAPIISTCFTDSFKALLFDIVNNISLNESVYDIKEYITSKRYDNEVEDMYILNQREKFLYNRELKIYVKIDNKITNTTENEKKEGVIKMNEIKITLYSYQTKLPEIRKYVETIKEKYLENLEHSRTNKQYIYTLCKCTFTDYKYECWQESIFSSSKTFENTFFERKEDIVSNIKFFLENREWYFQNGIPYTLGIGLSGKPGTGKTSFFKCLANMTGRHLIILSLKIIKTKQQLDSFFKEDTYHADNKSRKIGFDQKIIVIEDIDCMGNVVIDRSKQTNECEPEVNTISKKLLEQFIESKPENKLIDRDDLITLDDILNLWDGLQEMPGRILGISSNHYDKLDPALTRPGRIDFTLTMDYASKSTIQQMFRHYYKKDIDPEKIQFIKDKAFSPAQIVNFYISNKNDPDAFIQCLHR